MTPSVPVIATPMYPTLQSSQSRTLDTTMTTLHDQRVVPCPTYGTTLPPLSIDIITGVM